MPPPSLFGTNDPQAVVEKATAVANTLKGVLKSQKLISNISGKEYPKCEAWTLLGTMLGVYPVLVWTHKLENGWEARVEAKTRDGAVVGAAEAQCLTSERNWANRDDFALRSMAQTRATAKCLRMPLGFVMTLSGFEPTPAEEMAYEAPQPAQKPPQQAFSAPQPSNLPPQPQSAPKADSAPFPNAETRMRFLTEMKAEPGGPNAAAVHEYFVKAGAILETEGLDEIPLKFIPRMRSELRAVASAIAAFQQGEMAELAFKPHDEPEPAPKSKSAPKKAIKADVPSVTGKIQTVSLKEGNSARGPWSRFGIKVNDEWYSSFNKHLGLFAQRNKGVEVQIQYSEGKMGKDCVDIIHEGVSVLDTAESNEMPPTP
jgi:hypothetical protein